VWKSVSSYQCLANGEQATGNVLEDVVQ
jgi:hypothetical protein